MSPITSSPSSTPTVAGTTPASRTALSEASPDLDALAGGKPVRNERRLECHHAPALVERGGHLVGEPDHGIAPSCAQHRAAAARPSSAPPTRKPAASASPAPVVSTTVAATAAWSRPSTERPCAPALQHPACVDRSDRLALALGCEHELGFELAQPSTEAVVDERPGGDVDGDLRAGGPGQGGCRERRVGERSAQQRVTGDVQHVAIEPRGVELVGCQVDGRASVGGHRPVAVRGE